MNSGSIEAVSPSSRIAGLDVLRGIAVMGIFAMNIVNFAMPVQAYNNPAAFGLEGTADLLAWFAAFVVIDGKMRGLFSFLFGASMLLVIARAQDRGDPPARAHFFRMGWLLMFGLLHTVLVWDGDILVHYALVGMIAYAACGKSPAQLAGIAAVALTAQIIMMAGLSAAMISAQAAAAAPSAGAQVVASWTSMSSSLRVPNAQDLARDFSLHRGTWAGLVADRWREVPGDPLGALAFYGLETFAYMCAGMCALKTGFLTGSWARERYLRIAAVCLGLTVPAYAVLGLLYWRSGFDAGSAFAITTGAPTLLRPIMVVGVSALILVLTAGGGALVARVAAAGRCAFSNYLGASLIATTIFYGYGFGLYGRLSRWELYPLVFAVWMAMLLWSRAWLARFRYGPFEWAWRSLSRGELVAMRR